MKLDNSSYTVTPPDLMLTEHGVSVLVSSTDEKLITKIKDIFEKYIATSIVFYVQEKETNSNTLPWLWNVSKTCDFMIIDLDTCAEADIIAGLMKPIEDEKVVLFYSDKYTRRDTIKLINATGENLVVTRMEDIHNYIRLQMNPEYFDETK